MTGFQNQRRSLVSWGIVIFSAIVILAEIAFRVIWIVEGKQWSIANAWWAKFIGFVR